MVAFGEMNPQVLMQNRLLPPRGPNTYSAGIRDADKAFANYGPASSDYPNLLIVNPICDNDGNVILSGYYQLILSDERTMLSLVQRGQIIATVPVFKVEEDRSQVQAPQPRTYWEQKKADKEKIKKEKARKKKISNGEIPADEPQIYNNATIEYDEEGCYYLIKYERGRIRAWGAIK